MNSSKFTAKDLVCIAAMTAVLETAKFVLNPIPNVELVTLLVIVYTKQFGWKKTLITVLLFALIECLYWGFATWSIVYFYMWPLLVLLAYLCRNMDSVWIQASLAGFFGLFFGAFCAIVQLIIAGPHAALAWWAAGLSYDLVHGISNFIICLLLYKPVNKALETVVARYGF